MDNLEVFRQKEIKSLKKFRLSAWMLLILVDLGIIFFFLYGFYSTYIERGIATSFIAYVMPTIFAIQCILTLAFGLVGLFIYYRFRYAIREINNLNEEYLNRYWKYVYSIDRAFAGIPPYIFTQRGMVVLSNFGQVLYPPNSIDKLTVTIVTSGGMPRNIIKIYQNNKVTSSLNFLGFQTRRLEFLKTNVRYENPRAVIEEMKRNTWY